MHNVVLMLDKTAASRISGLHSEADCPRRRGGRAVSASDGQPSDFRELPPAPADEAERFDEAPERAITLITSPELTHGDMVLTRHPESDLRRAARTRPGAGRRPRHVIPLTCLVTACVAPGWLPRRAHPCACAKGRRAGWSRTATCRRSGGWTSGRTSREGPASTAASRSRASRWHRVTGSAIRVPSEEVQQRGGGELRPPADEGHASGRQIEDDRDHLAYLSQHRGSHVAAHGVDAAGRDSSQMLALGGRRVVQAVGRVGVDAHL